MITDWDADCDDRIIEAITGKINNLDMIMPAIRLAGRSLEHIKPAVLGFSPKGMIGGCFVNMKRGSVPFVFANKNKSLVIIIGPKDKEPIDYKSVLEDCVSYFKDILVRAGVNPGNYTHADIVHLLNEFINEHGAVPENPKDLENPVYQTCIGALFTSLREQISITSDTIREYVNNHCICPAICNFIGDASSGKPNLLCASIGLIFPVAPYIEITGLKK